MSITKDTVLPTDEELTVQEVNISSPVLNAAAFHLGKYCEFHNNEFLLCRFEEKDPRYCLNEGKAVTACALEFFQKVKKSCYDEFNTYSRCIDRSSGSSAFSPCRKTQAVFDKCALEKLNIERPAFGYFCEVKVHDTKRPPPKKLPKPVFEDLPKKRIVEDPKLPPVYGDDFTVY